jgi:uncharacterized membrane protein
MSKKNEEKSPSAWNIVTSVLAAMIGVQSDQNRERDFKHGSMGNYIFVGIVVVAIFVFSLIAIVNNILEETAK